MTSEEDIASVAGQLADLTHTVEEMAAEIKMLRERADSQQERSTVQHDRIDLAAQELHDVSERLQAASKALRESV
jgi:predicted  nucleic acid-binding Zn-ribbon protein